MIIKRFQSDLNHVCWGHIVDFLLPVRYVGFDGLDATYVYFWMGLFMLDFIEEETIWILCTHIGAIKKGLVCISLIWL